MVERKPLARFAGMPSSLVVEATVGEPRFKGGKFDYRIGHPVCSIRVPLLDEGRFAGRKVLVGRFNDCMEYVSVINDPRAISSAIEKTMDNYVLAFAELGAQGSAERARLLGQRLKAMKMLESGAHYAINLPGAFIMVSAISALIDISATQDVGYYDFSSQPLRTAVRGDTGDNCLMLPGGISIAVRPGP